MTSRAPIPLLVLVLALFGCGGRSSPTEPEPPGSLAGTWVGPLTAFPRGEDWSEVRLSLQPLGTTVTGTLVSRNGVSHPVEGRIEGDGAILTVMELPQEQAPCSVQLIVRQVSSVNVRGNLSGRCPNTIRDQFLLVRLS